MPEYSCTICGNFSSPRKSNLVRHMMTHTEQRPYSCSQCPKTFIQRRHLSRHMSTHNGEKPFSCPLCGKAFASSDYVTAHMKTHTGQKPFRCTVCERAFARRHHLKEHMNTHTGEKLFSCHVCGKVLGYSSSLNRHIKTQHSSDTTQVTTSKQWLSDGTTTTCTTHAFTTANTVTMVSQISSSTGHAVVTTVDAPSAVLTTVLQDAQPPVTTTESKEFSGLHLLATLASGASRLPDRETPD